jgi:hypothetical protein
MAVAAACASTAPAASGVASPGAAARSTAAAGHVTHAATAPVVPRLVSALLPWRLPVPLSRADAFPAGDRLRVAGGLLDGDVSTAAVWLLDPRTGAASVVALPSPRSDVAAAGTGRIGYLLGGYDGFRLPSAVLATSDGRTFRVVARLPQPRSDATALVLGGQIVVCGGDVGTLATASVLAFDPATGRLRTAGALPTAVADAAGTVVAGVGYLLGGEAPARLATAVSVRLTG